MRLFRLTSSLAQWWAWAHNLEEAVELSLKAELAKDADNIELVGDQTAHYLNPDSSHYFESTRLAVESGFAGIGCIQLPPLRTMPEILCGLAPIPGYMGWKVWNPKTDETREFFVLRGI